MSTYTIVALVILPVLGGVIAWAGDRIGYRLGKSRRSLFGLRPRSTARLVAVVVGVLLPLATMFVAAVGSQDVRTALFDLSQLQASRAQLTEENRGLQAQVATARSQRDTAKQEAAAAEQGLKLAQQRLALAQQRATAAQARATTAQRQATEADSRYRAAQTRLTQAQGQLRQAEQQLTASQQKLKTANVDLTQALDDEKHAAERVMALNTQVRSLNAEVNNLRAEADSAHQQLDQATRQLEKVKQDLADAQKAVADAQQNAAGLAIMGSWNFKVAATSKVRYEQGAELVRSLIGSGQTEGQVESSLNGLLTVASARAAAKGAPLSPDTQRAVVLVAPTPPDTTEMPPPEDQVIRAVAHEIKSAEAPVYVVSVQVIFRSFSDDTDHQVAIGLYLHPNVVVYPQGTVIVSQSVDGSDPRAEVFQQILGMLGGLRTAAREAGILPDPESGQYGQISADQLLTALDEIVARKQKTTLEAVAAEDVYVAGSHPFLVQLRLSPPTTLEGGSGG
jgi:uncharacterized protein (DUF3084 family)